MLFFLIVFGCEDKIPPINQAPSIASISITPTMNITTNTQLICEAVVEDDHHEFNRLSIEYSWTLPDASIIETGNILQLSPDFIQPLTTVSCNVSANDGEFAVAESISVFVINQEPEISFVSISPNNANVSSVVTCQMTSRDQDEEAPLESISWLVNDSEVALGSTLALTPDIVQKGEELFCLATAEDSYGGIATESTSIIIQNTPPILNALSIEPNEATSQDTLECIPGDIVDIDGDETSFEYQWFVDDVLVSEVSDKLSGPFDVGQSIRCQATILDDEDSGNTLETDIIIQKYFSPLKLIEIPDMNIRYSPILDCFPKHK